MPKSKNLWPEAESMARIRLAAAEHNTPLFRINSGAFRNPSGRLVQVGGPHWPDYFGIYPKVITADDVGKTLGQFIAIEAKAGGFTHPRNARERNQEAFLTRLQEYGALAQFSTGEWPFGGEE